MQEESESWTRADVLALQGQFIQRIPNVTSVVLNPPDLLGFDPKMPFGVLWIIQGRVAYGVPLVFN